MVSDDDSMIRVAVSLESVLSPRSFSISVPPEGTSTSFPITEAVYNVGVVVFTTMVVSKICDSVPLSSITSCAVSVLCATAGGGSMLNHKASSYWSPSISPLMVVENWVVLRN